MKQKNLVLVAVAVACGLIAAVLTSQMGASTAPPPVIEQVDVLVAAKDLPLKSKLTKDELDKLVVVKKYPKDAAPANAVTNKDELVDKWLTRTLRSGDFFTPGDLSNKPSIEIPEGYQMMAFPISPDQLAGGFAVPGSKVDIIASMNLPKVGRPLVFRLLPDMLILAVDQNVSPPPGQVAYIGMSHVSMAVTDEQALMLHAALTRGAAMRIVLRGGSRSPSDAVHELSKKQVWAVLNGEFDPANPNGKDEDKNALPKAPDVVELPVPTESLPAGTKLTEELIDKAFTMQKIVPPAPANVVQDIRGFKDKFLQKELSPHQFVPRSFLADEAPKPASPAPSPDRVAKGAPQDDGASPKEAPAVEPVKPPVKKTPPKFWDVTVQTATGAKKYRYQVLPNGKYLFVGEYKTETAPVEEPDPEPETPTPAPKASPKPAPEPEPKVAGL